MVAFLIRCACSFLTKSTYFSHFDSRISTEQYTRWSSEILPIERSDQWLIAVWVSAPYNEVCVHGGRAPDGLGLTRPSPAHGLFFVRKTKSRDGLGFCFFDGLPWAESFSPWLKKYFYAKNGSIEDRVISTWMKSKSGLNDVDGSSQLIANKDAYCYRLMIDVFNERAYLDKQNVQYANEIGFIHRLHADEKRCVYNRTNESQNTSLSFTRFDLSSILKESHTTRLVFRPWCVRRTHSSPINTSNH